MSKWVSVKDRLPDEGCFVLVYERHCDAPFIGFINSHNLWSANTEFYDTNGDAIVVDNIYQSDVTHWQPLPKPPEEQL